MMCALANLMQRLIVLLSLYFLTDSRLLFILIVILKNGNIWVGFIFKQKNKEMLRHASTQRGMQRCGHLGEKDPGIRK